MTDTKNNKPAEKKGFFSRRSRPVQKNEQDNESAVLNDNGLYSVVDLNAQPLTESTPQAAPPQKKPATGQPNRRYNNNRGAAAPKKKEQLDAAQNNQAATTQPTAAPSNQVAPKQHPPRTPQHRQKQGTNTANAVAGQETAAKPKTNNNRRRAPQGQKDDQNAKATVKIIPLGGLGEIGKNITVIEYKNDIIIVDCGLAFPDDDMPGIDLVIPDFNYILKNRDKVRGVFLTHGHEDHIGSLSYLLKEINVPVYSLRLTIGLVEGKLKEAGILNTAKLNVRRAGDVVKLGNFSVEFINVNHSIPDACALAIFTPVGTIVHTGDFKIDYTPVDGNMINLARFGELGSNGVLALLADSTNAERGGITPSERKVGESFEMLFKKAGDRRIILASFSSNVHRIQQVFDVAARHGRRVVVSGRSMENVTAKAIELGYLKVPKDILVELDQMGKIPDEQLVIITTGSQGEPMSALTRMARGDHRKIHVTAHDFIIISATPIPGNEKLVGKVINDLMMLGSEVIYESSMGIHVSGHACREELKTIIGLTKPKFFMPVHGEYKHLVKSRELAVEMGLDTDNVIVTETGRVVELTTNSVKCVTAVQTGAVMVDGIGIGDVGSIVLRDRKLLSEEGLFVVVATLDAKTGAIISGPDIVSRGFVYVRESEELLAGAKQVCRQALGGATDENGNREWANLKQAVKDQVGGYLYSKTKRRPMVLPIIQDVKLDK